MSPRLPSLCLLLLFLSPLPVLADGFARLSALADDGFRLGAEARLLDDGTLLGAIEPQRQLSPASVTKAYLAAAALDRWGPQHRFTTRLVSSATLDDDGVLHGDLILDGGGDPALTTEDLWRLVQRLHQAGVREVGGQLKISQWRFGPVTCLTTDRCRTPERTDNAYSALLSSAGVNYGSWCVQVAPGRAAGQPARVTGCDSQATIPAIDNRVETVAAGGGTDLDAERVSDGAGDRMVVTGRIAQDALPRDLYRASSDPAAQMALTLAAMLDQAGIALRQGAVTTTEAPPAGARQLAAVDGEPLQELLMRVMNYSNNYMADMLALGLAESPRAELRQGGEAIERFVAGVLDHGPLILHSGSGLTTENRTTAHGVTALLESMYHRPALFPSFVASFQSPGNGVMRFIRRGSNVFQHHVMLKTGTLNQPFAVRALGGYFRTRSGRWGVFGVLVNGTSSTPYLSWPEVLDPLSTDLERMIEAH